MTFKPKKIILTDSMPIGTEVKLKDGSVRLTTSFAWISMKDILVYVSGLSLPQKLSDLDIPRGWRCTKGLRPSDESISLTKGALS